MAAADVAAVDVAGDSIVKKSCQRNHFVFGRKKKRFR